MSRSLFSAVCVLLLAPGCGGRSVSGRTNTNEDPGSDAAIDNPDSSSHRDSGSTDGSAPSCAAQEIQACPEPCMTPVGVYWDGEFCRPIRCCCEGPDCSETYANSADCIAERAACTTNSCAVMSGYCIYGDLVKPAVWASAARRVPQSTIRTYPTCRTAPRSA